jgi:ribosomal protein S18 acetylase RimI-like enzyme
LEHDSLSQWADAARENVIQTYALLARSVPGTRLDLKPEYMASLGAAHEPFASFVAGFELETDTQAFDTASAIDALAADRPHLMVYICTGDRIASLKTALENRAFRRNSRLVALAAAPGASDDESLLSLAVAPADREAIARFMVDQFFKRMTAESRDRILSATARSATQLYSLGPVRSPHAAVMLTPMDGSLGLYNLCVRRELRSKGLGAQVVRHVLALAGMRGVPVVLQCEESLAPWYESQGFQAVGEVEAWRRGG